VLFLQLEVNRQKTIQDSFFVCRFSFIACMPVGRLLQF